LQSAAGGSEERRESVVDGYAEVKAQMPKIQREVNDIHSKDQQYWDEWHKYYQACLEYAQCMGTAPDCPEPPAQPSGRCRARISDSMSFRA